MLKKLRRQVKAGANKSRFPLSWTYVLLTILILFCGIVFHFLGSHRFFLLFLNVLFEFLIQNGTPRNFSSAKINKLNMPILGEHNILRLQIPMRDAHPMQILQNEHNLGNIENPHLIRKKPVVSSDEAGEITTMAVFEHVVEVF